MQRVIFLAATIGTIISLAASAGWTQIYTSEPPPSTSITTTTTTTVAPGGEVAVPVNPNDPQQFPPAGVGLNPDSHEGKVKAVYVDRQIASAKARGWDTSAAETQEVMGQADLRKGLNKEAAQHFDAALRSLGVTPNAPEQNSGEAGSIHQTMP